jgi:hypothetical protein
MITICETRVRTVSLKLIRRDSANYAGVPMFVFNLIAEDERVPDIPIIAYCGNDLLSASRAFRKAICIARADAA